MKPRIKQALRELAVLVATILLTATMVIFAALALLAAISAANAQTPLPPEDPALLEALTDVEACLGPVPQGPPPVIFVAPETIFDLCGLYDIKRHTILLADNYADTPSCGSLRDLLRHEIVHAYDLKHPEKPFVGTSLDEHYMTMRKCGFEGPDDATALPATLSFTATTSDNYRKYFAVGVHTAPFNNPLIVGVRMGMFNWTNIRDFEAYSPFGQLEVGLRLESRGLYVQATQGAGFVGTPPASIRGRGLATPLQFPTSVEVGLQAGPHSLGLHIVHYSNGTVGQRGRVYDGIGLTFSTLFN
jgi:hypothetical protein